MSGTSSVRDPRQEAQQRWAGASWKPVTTRDRFGRITTSYEKDIPGVEHDVPHAGEIV